eukprot:scaffold2705_cov109-Isochrysis_galbana.AAC.9
MVHGRRAGCGHAHCTRAALFVRHDIAAALRARRRLAASVRSLLHRRRRLRSFAGRLARVLRVAGGAIVARRDARRAARRAPEIAFPEAREALLKGKPQLGRWAFYWEGVFGAAQNVGRFWCRYPARLLWASGGHPRGQSRLIWVRQGPWVLYVEQAGRPAPEEVQRIFERRWRWGSS